MGPTYFSHFLKALLAFANAHIMEPTYHVFLILTDGEIHDMQQTVDAIVEMANLPISVIIVGVGIEKFLKME